MDCFSNLMDGLKDVDVDAADGEEKWWRNRVVEMTKRRRRTAGRRYAFEKRR